MSSKTNSDPKDHDEIVFGYPDHSAVDHVFGPRPKGTGAKATATFKPRTNPSTPAASNGPPLPKRPKGRLFIATVLLSIVGFSIFTIYDKTIRYTAYGEITAKTISIAAPWPGIINAISKRDGDLVESGELIARIDSSKLQEKIDSIDDALRVERAQLASDFETIRWEAEKIKDSRRLSQSDFFNKYSDLLWQQSRLSDLRSQKKRLLPLVEEGAASRERMQSLVYQIAGQEERIDKLKQAVEALKDRGDHQLELSLEDRVRPTLVRIENLQAELDRTRQLRALGEVRSTSRGRILRMNRFVGEYADQQHSVADIIVDNSQSAVLYLPQSLVPHYGPGKVVSLYIPSLDKDVRCEVIRTDMKMQTAPQSLSRYYASDQTLLPIHLRMTDEFAGGELPMGSELRLPRETDASVLTRAAQVMFRWFETTK